MSDRPATSALPAFRPDIDGLRAVAVLLVLVFHFDLVPGNKAGFIGVDVFFVISGFLITSILSRQMEAGTFSLRAFYVGRIRRLAPALTATLVLVLVAGALLLFPQDFVDLARQALASQFYVANIYYWRSVNYFGLGHDNVFLLHMWSLGVEEQFYVFYPLAMLWIHRRWPHRFWLAIGLALAVSFALNIAFVSRKPEATFYLLPTRAWELLAGAMLPRLARAWSRPKAVDAGLGIVGLGLIAIAVVAHGPGVRFPGFYAVLPVAGAACLLLSGERGAAPTARLLALAPLAWIGRISYPLYLVHWPVNVFASRHFGDDYSKGLRWLFFITSIGLAGSIYAWAESPVRGRSVLRTNRKLMHGYAAGLLLTVALFVSVEASGGLPQRFPPEVSRLAAYVNDRTPPLRECEYTGGRLASTEDFCRIGAPSAAPRWIVFGDSHAWATHAAFDRWLQHRGEGGLFAYRHACPPLLGIYVVGDLRAGCNEFNRKVFAFLAGRPEIGGVVLVSAWYEAPEGILSVSAEGGASPATSIDAFRRTFAATLERLRAMNKTIYVWEPVPGALGNVPSALARAKLDGVEPAIEVPLADYRKNAGFFFEAAEANRGRIDVRLSPSQVLCGSGRCAVTVGGVPAYFDNSHLTASTADYWAAAIENAESRAAASAPRP